ncbi:MAG: hypothetical protein WCO79_02500 [bacterium]
MPLLINKTLGETPLEALERLRAERIAAGEGQFATIPLTYAGRLDPMAEGLLVVLAGEECKKKADYLGLDKVYETDFLLGMETDTHDVLGVVQHFTSKISDDAAHRPVNISREKIETALKTFLGTRTQAYPAYSSKPYQGRPLFELARAGELPSDDEMPKREVEIYRIEVFGERAVAASELEKQIIERIALVKGDFRQAEIIAKWREFFHANDQDKEAGASGIAKNFQLFSLSVHCSGGTYIRSLAHEVGKRLYASDGASGAGAIAFSIKRTQVGNFTLDALHTPLSPSQNS